MVKRSAETFVQLCTLLTKDPRFNVACMHIGITETTLYRWLGASQQGDTSFSFTWLDEETPTLLHVATKQAIAMYHQAMVQEAEHTARFGYWTETRFRGATVYQRDPALDIYT